MNLLGGTIGRDLEIGGTSVLTIHGSDFEVDGQPVTYGELISIVCDDYTSEPARHLTGTLANGAPLDNNFYIGDTASIVLVPEPSTFLLLGLGVMMLRRKR